MTRLHITDTTQKQTSQLSVQQLLFSDAARGRPSGVPDTLKPLKKFSTAIATDSHIFACLVLT